MKRSITYRDIIEAAKTYHRNASSLVAMFYFLRHKGLLTQKNGTGTLIGAYA